MRCTACDHLLWRTIARQCPECGEPFKPSNYDFVPNSVVFRCPRCEQSYYGTAERGHLEPSEFTCVGCGHDVSMDDMSVHPVEGLQDTATRPGEMPWLERQPGSIVRPWLRTVFLSMFHPGRLIRGVPEATSAWRSFLFCAACNLIIFLAVLAPFILFAFVLPFFLSRGGALGQSVSIVSGFGIMTLVYLGSVMFLVVVWALVTHGALRLTGPTRGGLRRTMHAVFYGAAASVLTVVPCCGWYLGQFWWPVSVIIMVKEDQRIGAFRAILSVLAVPLLVTAATVGLYVWWISWVLVQASP